MKFVKSQIAAHPYLSFVALVAIILFVNHIFTFFMVRYSVRISMAQVLMDCELGNSMDADARIQLQFDTAPPGSRVRKIRDAHMHAKLRNWETAYKLWQETLSMPTDKERQGKSFLIELGDTFAQYHKTEHAMDVFDDLLRRYPNDPETCAHYAIWLNRWGHPKEALALMEIIIKSEPKIRIFDVVPYIQYLHRAGESDRALAVAKQVIAESPAYWEDELAKIRMEVASIEKTIARK